MYLLDVWANHQDNRQAVLKGNPEDNTREAFFIDHGQMFGGSNWNFEKKTCFALHLEAAVYTNLWHDEQVTLWISRFQDVVPKLLSKIGDSMPPDWYDGDLSELIHWLSDRLTILPELVQADVAIAWHPRQKKYNDEALRLSNSGTHDFRTSEEWRALHGGRESA
jgi:hypothetical protein